LKTILYNLYMIDELQLLSLRFCYVQHAGETMDKIQNKYFHRSALIHNPRHFTDCQQKVPRTPDDRTEVGG